MADLKMLKRKLHPSISGRNTGGIAQSLFKEYSMEPTVLLLTATVLCPSAWRSRDSELPLPQKAIFGKNPFFPEGCCFSIGTKTGAHHFHCCIPEKEISFSACQRLYGNPEKLCCFPISFKIATSVPPSIH